MGKDGARRWWAITRDAVRLWLACDAFTYAGALAFYTLFSLAPVVIIAVSVIGLVLGEQAAQGQIVAQLQDLMGREAAVAVEQAVARSRIQESGILPTLLGVSALLIGATTVFGQMQLSLNAIWGVAARPSRSSVFLFVKNRLLSLTVVLAIGFVLLVSLLAVALLFCAIFKVLPDVVLRWRDVVVGALVTASLFSIGRYAIAVYLTHTATASTYGAAGSVVLILLWVYYSSLILLFGAAFTKTQMLARGGAVVPSDTAVLVRRQLLVDAPAGMRAAAARGV
ncbi:partial hypothetical protein, partial [Gammaproteobacteria bacterium]